MNRLVRATLALAVVGLFAVPMAYAQGLQVNPDLAKKGKSLFTSKGCIGCHSIGKGRRSGPDLAGITEQRSIDWLQRWMKNPPQMMETDSAAQALLQEYKGVKMPNLHLRDEQIEALLHYIKQQSEEAGS